MGAEIDVVGQVVGGRFGDIIVRQKADTAIEIGDLLVSDEGNSFVILQVFALEYGSQIQERLRQMRAGVSLEREAEVKFYEPEFVNYVLARTKPLARVAGANHVSIPKSLPAFFNKLRRVSERDLRFLPRRDGDVFVGHIRSGTKVIPEAGVWLPAEKVFTHHVLIPATTGRGKSNLVKTMLYHTLSSGRVGALVLDAHDEYYGRYGPGLKDHPKAKDRLEYYTTEDPPPGATTLSINLQSIRPEHMDGIVGLSDAQINTTHGFHRKYDKNWLKELMLSDPSSVKEQGAANTMIALQRKVRLGLGLEVGEDKNLISRNNVFSDTKGENTVGQIVQHIEEAKVVVLDTSRLSDKAELLVGSIIASTLMDRYRWYKAIGQLDGKPVTTIVIEEAPRVIGEDVLKDGSGNVYAAIAKEGRKFKVGLVAVTQLSSVIPRTILANINTKIILGNEVRQEREAVIASSTQDLSDDDRSIASLDKGEAIITSIFVPFAMPIKIPLFEEVISGRSPRKRERMRVP